MQGVVDPTGSAALFLQEQYREILYGWNGTELMKRNTLVKRIPSSDPGKETGKTGRHFAVPGSSGQRKMQFAKERDEVSDGKRIPPAQHRYQCAPRPGDSAKARISGFDDTASTGNDWIWLWLLRVCQPRHRPGGGYSSEFGNKDIRNHSSDRKKQ